MTHSLTLGSLLLTDSLPDDDYGFVFNVLADGASTGAASGVQEVVRSLLADGDLTRVTRYGNREVTFSVEITGPSLAALSQGEAALRGEVGRANTLTWQAPDYLAAATVFEVITSGMVQQFDDLAEIRNRRTFTLTLTCSPFASSEAETVVATLPVGASLSQNVIDTCDVATGWTGTRGGAAFAASTIWEAGAVGVVELDNAVTAPETWTLTRTGSVSFASMAYLVVELRTLSTQSSDLSVSAVTSGGQVLSLPILARRKLVVSTGPNDYQEVTCLVPGGVTLSSVTFRHTSQAGDVWQGIIVRKVSQTNMPPGGSARQLSRILDVGGTERTPASLHAFTTSGFLGVTGVHTTPFDGSGYAPDMRRWRATGNTTSTNVDSRKITGVWEPMKPNPVVSRTPAHSLPRGDYLLVAALKADTVTTTTPFPISWAVKSVISGQVLGSNEGTGYGWFPVANQLTIVPIASFAAPIVRSGALDVEVHLLNPTSTLAMSVEEWWLFKDDEDSALSIVNTSEGNLWLDSPDTESGVPEYWVGPTKGTAYHPAAGLLASGLHTFKPGPVLVTSFSDSNDYLQVDMTYRKRWHSNAAE